MTNREILTKAIDKAIAAGWKPIDMPNMTNWRLKTPLYNTLAWQYPWILFREFNNDGQEVEINIERIIFSHDFAKALWPGTELDSLAGTYPDDVPASLYHLQKMVIADDPIKYLGEHV